MVNLKTASKDKPSRQTTYNFKLFLIMGLVIIFGLASYGYFQAAPGVENQAEPRPKIEISPPSFDFGEVEYGKVVDYAFTLKNTGSETLEIKRVSTSCGCTKAKVEKESLEPGEATKLLVTYNTGAMTGSHAKGKQERIIYVKSNDLVKPQAEVMITAKVK